MASSHITSSQIDVEKVQIVTDFIFSQAPNHCRHDCSHEIKRLLLSGRRTMTNLDRILKRRDITSLAMVCVVKAVVFPVVM